LAWNGPILAVYAFVVALAHALILGLPLGLRFQRVGWANIFTAVGAGFLIGALPLGSLIAFSWPSTFEVRGGVVLALDGQRTFAGWIEILRSTAMYGLYGALGGLTAWLAWRGGSRTTWIFWAIGIAILAAVVALARPF
jgi:hypothetical protein